MLNKYIKDVIVIVSAFALMLSIVMLMCSICPIPTPEQEQLVVTQNNSATSMVVVATQDKQNETSMSIPHEEVVTMLIEIKIPAIVAMEPEITSDIVTNLDVKLFNNHSETFNLIDGSEYISTIQTFLSMYAPEDMFISAACAQAYTEGGAGKQGVYRSTNNCFGITAGPGWKGLVFSRSTQLVYKDYSTAKQYGATDLFRAYNSIEESVIDYIQLISGDYYAPALDTTTPKEYLSYLLNKGYGEKESLWVWLEIIDLYDLEQYD